MKNEQKLFYGSCFALITTAFSFAFRASILPSLGAELNIGETELGYVNMMWFWGFPISMIIGGLIYHSVGGKKIMQFALFAHSAGIIFTVLAPMFGGAGYAVLLIATLLIGLGNGCTEAACNPMIADTYSGNMMSKMMNRFHMWFPGGIVIGSLITTFLPGLSWQAITLILLVPTAIYAYMFAGTEWPKAKTAEAASYSGNLKAMASPLFIFMLAAMAFTAMSEFAPQQWVAVTLAESGAQPMVVLALATGLMAVARYFGGEAVHRFNTTGVLLGSAILATIGLFLFSTQTGAMVYVAAVVYGLGIAYFWPNMIGFIADFIPKSGALGMSIVGAMGMFMSGLVQPVTGGWIESNREKGIAEGMTGGELELFTGQETLGTTIIFPIVLIGMFTVLYIWMKRRAEAKPEAVAA
ncbi:MAG: MFS transporter [Bacteroidota bacterium]